MADAVEAPSEPAVPAPSGSVAVEAFQKAQAAENISTPAETPEEPAPAPATSTSIVIPIGRIPEKFRANPDAVFGAYENSERAMHSANAEAAKLRRDNEALNARIAAAEQVNRMQPAPAQPPADPYGGVNMAEAVITDTNRFVDTTISLAEKRAIAAAEAAAQRVGQQFEQRQTEREQANVLVSTFERAKQMARDEGYTVSDDEWRQHIGYIAPTVIRENEQYPGVITDPKRYVEHFKFIKGNPPKATIPEEGNPPVSARAAPAPNRSAAPTLSREEQQLKKQIWSALGLKE